jgi:hypothetical protein
MSLPLDLKYKHNGSGVDGWRLSHCLAHCCLAHWPEPGMKLCGAGIFGRDSKFPTLLRISAAYARNGSAPDNPNKNVPTN